MHASHSLTASLIAACAALMLAAPDPAAAQDEVVITGVLNTIWGDVGPGVGQGHHTLPEYLVVDDAGSFHSLLLDPALTQQYGGPHRLNRKRVRVSGVLEPETGRLQVRSIGLDDVVIGVQEAPGNSHLLGSHATGSQKWITVLCRFGDATGVTPEQPSFFDDLMAFMDDFWQELSYGIIDLTGSDVVGWFDMAQNRGAYLDDPATHFAGHTLNFGEISQDCAAAADASVNFPDFAGINFIFNQDLDCCSWGGSISLNLDGMMKTYSATWMATWGWGNQDVLGQEMGHGFGLPHSSGPYTATYDSQWDVMSGGGTCNPADSDFGCVGVHTIGFHKDALGWISDPQRYMATAAADQLVTLERLAEPTGAGFRLAQIPMGGSATHFYTVECRKPAGYDDQIPGTGVLIHEVDTTLGDRNAQVVDGDADDDPNDGGAIWTPVEVFEDAPNAIRVAVLDVSGDTCQIAINPSNLAPSADAGPDRFAECSAPGGTPVTLDGSGSSDPDGDALTYAWSAPGIVFDDATSAMPTGAFPLGLTLVTLEVSDGAETDDDQTNVTVSDTTPPSIVCPPNVVIECNAAGGVAAADPQIQAFLAGVSASDVCDASVALANDAPAFFPVGATAVTFTATDASTNASACVASVTVQDTTPPEIGVSVDPALLWPPNHELVGIGATVEVNDVCDATPGFVLTSVTSSEPDDGRGDGHTTGDIQGVAPGTPDLSFSLRAERSGNGPGRIYTVLYTASDDASNEAAAVAGVRVPHDRRK